ncbi:MATH domain and coiled-coil domain-containing protein [Rosa sericea]
MGSEKCNFEEQLDCSWRSPHHGWKCLGPKLEAKRYRLNVAGSRGIGSRSIGGGGVIRNEKGEWVAGFAENLGTGRVVEAKLWALYRGLELAWKSGWAPLGVECDSNVAVTVVMNQVVHQNHSLFQLVKSCQELLKQNWKCSLGCVSAEQNCVAIFLANLGLSMKLGCHYFDVPPPACAPFLVQDECSVAPPGSVAARKMKTREADRMIQRDARRKNLRVRKLIQKARRMQNRKVKEDRESVIFTWRIDTFSKLDTFQHYSEPFNIGGFKWRIVMYPQGNKEDYLSVYLDMSDARALPLGWSRYAKFSLTLVDQLQCSKSITKEIVHVFNACERDCGFKSLVPLSQFYDHGNGYIVNDICIIEAKVAILQDHGFSAPVEPFRKEKEGQGPSNVQPVTVPGFFTRWETPSCEQVPASYHNAPSSEQNCTELPNISIAKESEVVSSTSADELMDFRGLAKIQKAFVPLLDEVCSCHSSLIECQMKQSPTFIEWAFTALGRVLHFLKTKKVKDMTDDVCADLELLWKELQIFKFDLAWLKPHIQGALRMNKLVKRAGQVKILRKDVVDLEIENKRLMAKLEVARRDLEKAEGVEEMDMDKELGYGG